MQEAIEKLMAVCKEKNLCWSIGFTRLADYECRIWRRKQSESNAVILTAGKDFQESIDKALSRLSQQEQDEAVRQKVNKQST